MEDQAGDFLKQLAAKLEVVLLKLHSIVFVLFFFCTSSIIFAF